MKSKIENKPKDRVPEQLDKLDPNEYLTNMLDKAITYETEDGRQKSVKTLQRFKKKVQKRDFSKENIQLKTLKEIHTMHKTKDCDACEPLAWVEHDLALKWQPQKYGKEESKKKAKELKKEAKEQAKQNKKETNKQKITKTQFQL
jgi:hypothetical protein